MGDPRPVNGSGLHPDPDRIPEIFAGMGRDLIPLSGSGSVFSNKKTGRIRNIVFRPVLDPDPDINDLIIYKKYILSI